MERFIRRCLDSIYLQAVDECYYEVIIVNDGTPDNSMKIVKEFRSAHSNIIIVNQENSGLSVARNTGLKQAKGDYVWFVDSDDWLTSDSIKNILPILRSNKYDIISSDLIYSYDDEKLNWTLHREKEEKITPAKYLIGYPVGAVQRYIIRRLFLINNHLQFYPGIYHEDAEFAPRMIIQSDGVMMLSCHLYHYYQRANSIMSSWKLKNTQDYCFVVGRHLRLLDEVKKDSLRTALKYYILLVYLHAFPKKQLNNNYDVKIVYQKEKSQIRKIAYSLANKNLPIKKLIKVWLCIINPYLVLPKL